MKIKDICTSVTDGSHNPPQGIEKSEYMMLSSKNIFDDEITFDEPRFLSEKDFEREHKRTQIAVGDVLLTIVGTVGRTAVVDEDMPAFALQRSVAVLHPKNDVCLPRFLMYALRGKRTYIENRAKGVAQKGIYLKEVSDIDIYIPDISNQEIIINKLDKVNTIIKLRQEELLALDNLIKARFVELFECGDHEIVKASDVCDFITKGTTPPTGEITEEYENGKIPFLKVYNLSFTGEMLFDENPQYILAETHNGKLARSKVYPNDVLMNIVGPPLGKFTLVTDEFEEWNINQAIAIFRAKERILPRFLLHALMQPKVLEPFIGQAVGIRQQNLSLEQCRNLQFPLPSLEEQKSFVEFAEQLDKSKVAVQKALDETQMLFDSLMQEYFG